jgi:hypothetical protein
MASYVIYIPGKSAANPQHLHEVGLGDILADGASPEFIDVQKGPDGGSGVLCGWRKGDLATDCHLGVHESQQWIAATEDPELELPAKRWWLGVELQRKVQPEDIERSELLKGQYVTLNDGASWLIPQVSLLPHNLNKASDGKWRRFPKPQYASWIQRADEYFRKIAEETERVRILADEDPEIDPTQATFPVSINDGCQFACEALMINYRLAPDIISALDLLDDHAIAEVVVATIELDQILEVRELKKKYSPVGIPVG